MKYALLLSLLLMFACGDDDGVAEDTGTADSAADVATDTADAAPDGEVDTAPANMPPVAQITADTTTGEVTLNVSLDGAESSDPDGTIVSYAWDFGDGEEAEGVNVTHEFTRGCFTVTLTVTDDDGASASASVDVVVSGARSDVAPALTSDVISGGLAPRDRDTNLGSVRVQANLDPGMVTRTIQVVRTSSAEVVSEDIATVCADDDLALDVTTGIPAELEVFEIRVSGAYADESERALGVIEDLVAGDVLLIQGQSNAAARQFNGDANVNQGPFLRSFGGLIHGPASADDRQWHLAGGNAGTGSGHIGQWGMRMARALIDEHGVPLAVINGAHGGQPIGFFQRDDAMPTNPTTNYGRFLSRVQDGGLAEHVRAILFYQGESDGPDGAAHMTGFTSLYQDWLEDFPTTEHVYVTQTRFGCGGPASIAVRDVQRRFPETLSLVTVMSTTGIDGHDGCHYDYTDGYEVLGLRYAALLGRDLYGVDVGDEVEPPNPMRAVRASPTTIRVSLTLPQALIVDAGNAPFFRLEGSGVAITNVEAFMDGLRITTAGDASAATHLIYDGHVENGPWIKSASGLGMLTFRLAL